MKKLLKTLVLAGTLALMVTGCSSNTNKPTETEDVSTTIEPTKTEDKLKLTDEEIEKLKIFANSITKSIINCDRHFKTDDLSTELSYIQANNISVDFLYINIDKDNPYYDLFQFTYEDGDLIKGVYSYSSLTKFYNEVFPDSTRYWNEFVVGDGDSYDKNYFDEDKQEIIITDFNWGYNNIDLNGINLISKYNSDNNKIESTFDLKQKDDKTENYTISYKILENNDNLLYIQYDGIEKTED